MLNLSDCKFTFLEIQRFFNQRKLYKNELAFYIDRGDYHNLYVLVMYDNGTNFELVNTTNEIDTLVCSANGETFITHTRLTGELLICQSLYSFYLDKLSDTKSV